MALTGGGGAPNVTGGGNPAGTGTALNYVLNRVYAYSGGISTNGNETDLLNFSTGNEVLHTTVYVSSLTSTDAFQFNVYINGEVSFFAKFMAGANYGMPRNVEMPMLLPPFSEVRITAQNVTDTTSHDCCATVTGVIV